MQRRKPNRIDDAGGSVGIVTIEDLVEDSWNIYDEYDIVDESIQAMKNLSC